MSPEYPWYELADEGGLQQGDFLFRCPVVQPVHGVSNDHSQETEYDLRVKIVEYDVIVINQSCDLVNKKQKLVLVCPHWSLGELEITDPSLQDKNRKENIRRGYEPGLCMLGTFCPADREQGRRIVNFRHVFALPIEFATSHAAQQVPRLRLLTPYREYLAQAFARFFMRVGLPLDIPSFT